MAGSGFLISDFELVTFHLNDHHLLSLPLIFIVQRPESKFVAFSTDTEQTVAEADSTFVRSARPGEQNDRAIN